MRTRIVGLALVAAALALGLFGLPLAVGLAHFSGLEQQATLQRIASFAARSVQNRLTHGESPTELPTAPDGTELAYYDEDGDRVIGSGPPSGVDPPPNSSASGVTRTEDGAMVAKVPVSDGHDVVGVVRAATPVDPVQRKLVLAWLGMAALAGLVLLAVWILARRHARRLARPLEELAGTARRLGDGDFSVRSATAGVREIDAVGGALNSTAIRLDDLLARERAFSADASHQLRTPLAGLRLRLEAALDSPEDDLRQAVQDGIAAADRLEQTIDELLLLAREQPGKRGEPISVEGLTREIQDGWGPRLAAHGRSLAVHVESPLPTPRASAASTRQVVAVLLDNAEVHGAGTVRVTVRATSDAIAVDISDEGPGIMLDQSAMFADATSTPGHGIGLALARRLAEAEGGRLLLAQPSPPVFTLLLPADWAGDGSEADLVNSAASPHAHVRDGRSQPVRPC